MREKVVSYRNSTSNHNSATKSIIWSLVVSYRNSTSNHNSIRCHYPTSRLYLIEILHQTTTFLVVLLLVEMLYLIEILHQTTTPCIAFTPAFSCILSKFYIKPQLEVVHRFQFVVVSYRNSTSNHNVGPHID